MRVNMVFVALVGSLPFTVSTMHGHMNIKHCIYYVDW
jgi:hypothetical protein